jgi:hypothetical protein
MPSLSDAELIKRDRRAETRRTGKVGTLEAAKSSVKNGTRGGYSAHLETDVHGIRSKPAAYSLGRGHTV